MNGTTAKLVIVAAVVGLLICVAALGSVATLMWATPWTLAVLVGWIAAGTAVWFIRKPHTHFEADPTWS